MRETSVCQFEHTIHVTAAPTKVIAAFFDPTSLATWWKTARSVTTPRPLGIYAVEWEQTPFQDTVLGSLGGVFYGTVMEFRNGREFLVADAHWLPPESDPIGPMVLEVTCKVSGPATALTVRQSSSENGERWSRYYDLVASGWIDSLTGLKRYLEHGGQPRLPARGFVFR